MNEVDLGEYMIFCKDFQIPLSKAKLTEIFKKASLNHKPHKFEQFFNSLTRIGNEMNKVKIDDINVRTSEINKALRKKKSGSNSNSKIASRK